MSFQASSKLAWFIRVCVFLYLIHTVPYLLDQHSLLLCGMCCVLELQDAGGCKVAGAGGDARTGGAFFRA